MKTENQVVCNVCNKSRYTRNQLIGIVLELKERLGKTPTIREIQQYNHICLATFIRFFGSWKNTLKTLNLSSSIEQKKSIKQKILIEKLIGVYKKLGRLPLISEYHQFDLPDQEAYCRYFGSWKNVLQIANLQPKNRQNYTDKELIDKLCNLKNILGRSPTIMDMNEAKDYPSGRAYYKRFGSWNNALKKANIEKKKINKKYSSDFLKNRLVDLGIKLNRTPKRRELKEYGYPCEGQYTLHFGSWNKALQNAGLKENKIIHNKDFFLEFLRNKYKELGRAPTSKEFKNTNPSLTAIQYRFGSLRNAFKQAGIKPNEKSFYIKKKHTDEYLLSKLREAKSKTGHVSAILIKSIDGMPSTSTYILRFGSFSNSLRKAGIPINKTESDPFNRKFWKAWQDHCEEMAKALYGEKRIEFQKSDFTDKHPDMFIVTKRKHIDAKISGYEDFQEQIDEYTKEGCSLEFWCIWKAIENTLNSNVKYFYAEELAGIMKLLGRTDLAKKCYLFKQNVIPDIYQQELADYESSRLLVPPYIKARNN